MRIFQGFRCLLHVVVVVVVDSVIRSGLQEMVVSPNRGTLI